MVDKSVGVVEKFDAYVKKVLSNELKYLIRSQSNREKHMVVFSDLNTNEESQLIFEDTYSIDVFRKRIETRRFDAVICDELLYEALQRINPKIREIIVLKFWGKYTDKELGEILDMSRQMITYNKNKAIKLLRKIIRELKKNDARFEL